MATVLVIIGPSGSGKSSVVRELSDRGLVNVHPTWTTRPRRPDEADGSLEHRFVTDAEFDGLDAGGFFIETAALFGLPFRYGLPAVRPAGPGPIDAVMLRAPLVARLAVHLPDRLVYQIADTADRTRARLVARGTGLADVVARVADNRREVELGRSLADRTFVNDGSLAGLVDAVAAALAGDTARLPGREEVAA